MPYKKFVRESERDNEFEHAKIIAIVNMDGEVMGYDYTITLEANDYFADPEDRKKYRAITVKPVMCESMSELDHAFTKAMEYMQFAHFIMSTHGKNVMRRIASCKISADGQGFVNDHGVGWGRISYIPSVECKVSPLARCPNIRYLDGLAVVNPDIKEANYRLGDQVLVSDCSKKRLVTIEACHSEMWFRDDGDDHFVQDVYIGRMYIDANHSTRLILFNPEHVYSHKGREQEMTQAEYGAWLTSGKSDSDDPVLGGFLRKVVKPGQRSDAIPSESESDNDEPVLGDPLPYRMTITGPSGNGMTNCMMKVMEKIKLEQRSDASPPESEPTPEQSGEADPEQAEVAAPAEQIVPPQAPMLRRRCDRPGWKPRQ